MSEENAPKLRLKPRLSGEAPPAAPAKGSVAPDPAAPSTPAGPRLKPRLGAEASPAVPGTDESKTAPAPAAPPSGEAPSATPPATDAPTPLPEAAPPTEMAPAPEPPGIRPKIVLKPREVAVATAQTAAAQPPGETASAPNPGEPPPLPASASNVPAPTPVAAATPAPAAPSAATPTNLPPPPPAAANFPPPPAGRVASETVLPLAEEASEPKRAPNRRPLIVALIGVILLAAAGWIAYTFLFAQEQAGPVPVRNAATNTLPTPPTPNQVAPGASTGAGTVTEETPRPGTHEPDVPATLEPPPEAGEAVGFRPELPGQPPVASAAFRDWVENLRISGVRAGSSPRVFIDRTAYGAGDLVNPQLGIRFEGYNSETRMLRFKDRNGAVVERRH